MPATPLEVYLPCDVLTVKVQVGPQEHLSSLEKLFLEAVYESVNHFHELVDLYFVGVRIASPNGTSPPTPEPMGRCRAFTEA